MEVIIILFGVAGLIWFMAFQRHLSVLVGGLMVVLVGTTFGHPFFNFNLGPIPITIDRVMLLWLVMASAVLWKMGRSDPKSFNRTDLIVVVLMGLLIASTFLHDWQYKEKLPLSRLLFFNLLPVCLYFVAKHCRVTIGGIRVFYSVLMLFGIYLALTGIFEQRQWYALVFPRYITDPAHWEFLGRARGPFLNPVSCGIFLSVCMVSAAFLWREARPLPRVFLSLAIVLCLLASALTLTRSVWVGCAVSAAIVCWFPAQMQVRGALVVAGTIVLLVAVIVLSDKVGRFQRDKDVTEAQMAESAKLRPMLAYVAYKMTRDKPLFGHGFGQYTKAKKPYHYAQTNGMQLSRIMYYMQHNVFLSYLTETGVIGFALLCLLLTVFGLRCFTLWNSRAIDMHFRQFGLLGLTMIAVYLINGMFHDVSIIPHVNAMLFLLLGVSENLTGQSAMIAGQIDARTASGSLAQAA